MPTCPPLGKVDSRIGDVALAAITQRRLAQTAGLFYLYRGFIPTCQPEHFAELAKKEKSMSSLICKKGDLAVVVRDDYEQNNLGLIVRVETFAGSRPFEIFSRRHPSKPIGHRSLRCWLVIALGMRGICMMDAADRLFYTKAAWIPDCYLRPIRGHSKDMQSLLEQGVPDRGIHEFAERV